MLKKKVAAIAIEGKKSPLVLSIFFLGDDYKMNHQGYERSSAKLCCWLEGR